MKLRGIYIGLGSNLNEPCLQIKKAVSALDELAGTEVLSNSGYFKSKPMGPEDQPDYINAVVEIETQQNPVQLLASCKQIEQQQGRVKQRRWGERSIDLDILLFADQEIETESLVVPHPGICQRDFVYMPLLKINPELKIPGKGTLKVIVESVGNEPSDYACQFLGNIK